jgi:aminoglycoside phosphotransferase (APT) family kinase protein
VESVNRRVPDAELGPRIAAGRDTVIYALGDDRVVRRAADDRSFEREAVVMEHAAAAGYPVPAVHRLAPGEMVLERIAGPTMLEDLGKRPWRLKAHARLLADLHDRLHRIEAPPDLPAFPAAGNALLHLDLHPANVILSPKGPVVIDWTNARRGDPAADLALTWIVMAVFDADETGRLQKAFVSAFRKRFVRLFLDAADRDAAAAVLPVVADYRQQDRNIRPAESAALQRLVEEVSASR